MAKSSSKGPNLFAGYWRREEATRAAFVDGWFRTGDLAECSADGYYTLSGRKSDLIISGGFNIYPREIEEFLQEQEEVAEAAVVGVPRPRPRRSPRGLHRLPPRHRPGRTRRPLPRKARLLQSPARVPHGRFAPAQRHGQNPKAPASPKPDYRPLINTDKRR